MAGLISSWPEVLRHPGSKRGRFVAIVFCAILVIAAGRFLALAYERLNRLSSELADVRSDLNSTRRMLAELNSDQSEARDAVNLNTEVRQEGQASAELAAAQSAIISLRTDIVQLTSEITKQNRQLNGFEGKINELTDFAL